MSALNVNAVSHLLLCVVEVVDEGGDLVVHHVGEVVPGELVERLVLARHHDPPGQQTLVQAVQERQLLLADAT